MDIVTAMKEVLTLLEASWSVLGMVVALGTLGVLEG
jgi:hypothetical protein